MLWRELIVLNKSDDFIKPSENYVAAFERILSEKCLKYCLIIMLVIFEVGIAHCYLIKVCEEGIDPLIVDLLVFERSRLHVLVNSIIFLITSQLAK